MTVTVLLLAVFISLGTWQVNRSVEKRILMENFEQAPAMPLITMAELEVDWEQYQFRRIRMKGSYDLDHQILLENQLMNRRSGYMVFTPFKLEDRDLYVLVNRGWVERVQGDSILPNISITEDIVEVSGLVSHPPGVGIKMGSLDQSPMGWPKSIPYIDTEWMALQLGAELFPWVVLLGEDQAAGFIRSWKPAIAVRMPPEKHQSYAFQWYSLAIALIFIFVVGSLKPEGKVNDDDR